ncbi:MAG: NAD(P)-dependent oxidoreductase [Desulfatiglans sp.]|jgi:nucleoside-diphosphate-sugar epimerase|nr:NAD(P)-dependent oxidoreductase [Desulfatiglans sp.]
MRVFVTGASGFIGSHVIERLISTGHKVAALVKPGNPMMRLKPLENTFELFSTSLEDTCLLRKSINTFQPEACIHLAWYAEPGKYLNSEKNIQSLASSLSLFQILIEAGCKQIIAAGTCFEYDTSFGYLNEDTPARPANLYASTKLSCYLTGSQLAAKSDIAFAWGRIFYPYGQSENPNRLVPAAIMALNNNQPFPASPGEQIRDYIHVSDVASAFCTLLEKQADGIYNISTGIPVSIKQLLDSIGELMNKKDLIRIGELPYRVWEPPFICGANNQLKSLGWNPFFSLKNGLLDVING